jgi:hypothetical protein
MLLHVCVALALFGCSDDPTNEGPATGKTIDSAGGSVESGGASVVVPEGALEDAVEVAVEVLDDVATDLPEGTSLAGDTVAFLPHGTTFSSPVTLTIAHDGSATGVMRLDDEDDTSWEAMSDVTVTANTVEVQTTSFSIYAAVAGAAGSTCAGGTEISGVFDLSSTNPPTVTLDGYRATILWPYDDGNGDRIYKFGDGTVSGMNFTICVPDAFPMTLQDSAPFQFGVAVFFAPSDFPADGEVSESTLMNLAAFANGTYFVVKHPAYAMGMPPAGFWANSFPLGLACGTCQAGGPDMFDTLSETPCAGSSVELTAGDLEPGCNLF